MKNQMIIDFLFRVGIGFIILFLIIGTLWYVTWLLYLRHVKFIREILGKSETITPSTSTQSSPNISPSVSKQSSPMLAPIVIIQKHQPPLLKKEVPNNYPECSSLKSPRMVQTKIFDNINSYKSHVSKTKHQQIPCDVPYYTENWFD